MPFRVPIRRVLASLVALGFIMSACGTTPEQQVEITDAELALVVSSWPNMTGLGQTDPEVWRPRLQRSCADGVWDHAVAERLASDFIAQDLGLSLRADGSIPDVSVGAQALWLMARNACGELFPPEAIEQGPPSGLGG